MKLFNKMFSLTSFSSSSWILFGIIALVAVIVIWKWWNKPKDISKKDEDAPQEKQQMITEGSSPPPTPTEAPPMVFAVNDGGNLDLADMSGKVLNIGYGPSPKTYIGLLDQAENDVIKVEEEGAVRFGSKVGTTKLYQVGGRPYIINYTRL
jgi:hypothetical protein